jgi:hypothetical protein
MGIEENNKMKGPNSPLTVMSLAHRWALYFRLYAIVLTHTVSLILMTISQCFEAWRQPL